jgi:DNA-binding transcriptional regulator YiaG
VRAPVRFQEAYQFAKLSGVSIAWLADGLEPKNLKVRVEDKTLKNINKDELLSVVYDSQLKPLFKPLVEGAKKNPAGDGPTIGLREYWGKPTFLVGNLNEEDVLSALQSDLKGFISSTPPHLYAELWSNIIAACWRFQERHVQEIGDMPEGIPQKKDLTDTETIATTSDVKAQLPKLLERLKKASSASGKKSELANFLGVPLASVSRWLSGEREPGGEITLKMFHWVEQQERQK